MTRARGELIRVQLALAKPGTETDPSREYSLRYASESMTADHGRAWARDVAELVDSFHFDRGFVELAGLSAEAFLERAQLLFSLAPIRHLDLSGAPGAISELFASPHLRRIRSLRLEGCGLTDADAELLASSPHLSGLRWLSLADNRIGMAGARALAASPFLGGLRYASFLRNLVEPNEQYSYDNGFVVDAWLPEDGLQLEREHGHLRWLHHDARSIADSVPDRFRMAASHQ